MRRFLADFGPSTGSGRCLTPGRAHGGMLAIDFYEPVVGDLFVAGDAAGQCPPLTGEGIRVALYHGFHCGRAIRGVLQGEMTPEEARSLYRQMVVEQQHTYRRLLRLQRLVGRVPEPALAWIGQLAARPWITRRVLRRYLAGTGWFLDWKA